MRRTKEPLTPPKLAKETVRKISYCEEGTGRRVLLDLDSITFLCGDTDYFAPSDYTYFWECSKFEAVIGLCRPYIYKSEDILLKMALLKLEQELQELQQAREWRKSQGRKDKLPPLDRRIKRIKYAIDCLEATGCRETELPDVSEEELLAEFC